MRHTILFYFGALMFLLCVDANAQDKDVRRYSTQYYMDYIRSIDSTYSWSNRSAEQHAFRFMEFDTIKTEVELNLQIHVLGDLDDISSDAIGKQISILNTAFSGGTTSSEEYASSVVDNTFITFKLRKNGGDEVAPINYVEVDTAQWTTYNTMKYKEKGGCDAYQPDQNINIWIVDLAGDYNTGYAQMPGSQSETDGIVIDWQFFGVHSGNHKHYDKGMSLVHLIGNYLNLHDLWSEKVDCLDDYVKDTHVHHQQSHDCGASKVTICYGDQKNAMFDNYMDNSYDQCQSMFTYGQRKRMHANFYGNGLRTSLINK